MLNSKKNSVMLTVKEFGDGSATFDMENPVRLYHHRVEKPLPSVTSVTLPIEQEGRQTTPGATYFTLRQLLTDVKCFVMQNVDTVPTETESEKFTPT